MRLGGPGIASQSHPNGCPELLLRQGVGGTCLSGEMLEAGPGE